MTTSKMCEVLLHNIERYEQHAATITTGSSPTELIQSVTMARNGAKLMHALRDRLIAADKLAEAAATVVTEQGDPAYRHEPDPIKSELRFWRLRRALREYRGEKEGGE